MQPCRMQTKIIKLKNKNRKIKFGIFTQPDNYVLIAISQQSADEQ